MKGWLTTGDLVDRFGVTRQTAANWARGPLAHAVTIDRGALRFDPVEVDKFAAARAAQLRAEAARLEGRSAA